jgi:hypothetical protein
MGVTLASLDAQLSRAIRELHDYLWKPEWKGDEAGLRKALLGGARNLDTALGAKGRLRRSAEALATPWSREKQGSSLFELLDDTLGLTVATEHVRKTRYREAAARAQAVLESTSIGVCSAARSFEIVEEWEARKVDFETYANRLADVLQTRFILEPGQFKRVLVAVHDIAANWDGSASKTEQGLAARAAIEGTAWSVSRSTGIRAMLGEPSKVPEKEFGALLHLIVNRL